DHEGPDGELPVSHVEAHADRRSKLVAVAGKEVMIGDFDARWISEQAINLHGFSNNAAKVLPVGNADCEPFRTALLGKGDPEVLEGHQVPLGVEARGGSGPERGGAAA